MNKEMMETKVETTIVYWGFGVMVWHSNQVCYASEGMSFVAPAVERSNVGSQMCEYFM